MDDSPDTASPIEVEVRDVHYARGGRPILDGFSCTFPRGRISVIAGASGSGKTTLLRMIACLIRPQRGTIAADGIADLGQLGDADLASFRRRTGMLFQGGALLDSMTVFDNVALPLREHTALSERDVAAEVTRRLAAVGLADTGRLMPRQLSGGMMRRAALARAIVMDPEILLCDEPFSGLDPLNVRRIEALLMELNQRLGLTRLVTSHHLPSSLRMADQLVFLIDGGAVPGAPKELLRSRDERIREFLEAERIDFPVPAAAQAPR